MNCSGLVINVMQVPNPNLLIFKFKKKMFPSGMESYHSPDDFNNEFDSFGNKRESLPLVKKLWELGNIKYTLVCGNSVHVEIAEDSSWKNLRTSVKKIIEEYLEKKR